MASMAALPRRGGGKFQAIARAQVKMFLRTWATQLWQQLSSDHPSSRAKIMGMKIKVHLYYQNKRLPGEGFYYLNAASFPMFFSFSKLKQIAFRIATTNFHLVSLNSL